jgi:hypothetical protein
MIWYRKVERTAQLTLGSGKGGMRSPFPPKNTPYGNYSVRVFCVERKIKWNAGNGREQKSWRNTNDIKPPHQAGIQKKKKKLKNSD